MSAIELMDPKMDQCFGIDVCTKREDLLEITLDSPLTDVDTSRILSILINMEASYLDGKFSLHVRLLLISFLTILYFPIMKERAFPKVFSSANCSGQVLGKPLKIPIHVCYRDHCWFIVRCCTDPCITVIRGPLMLMSTRMMIFHQEQALV